MRRVRIRLPESVGDQLEAEADHHYPKESGGVLLGFPRPGKRAQIQICEQIGPGPKAVHLRDRFEPDSDWQADRIAERYIESGRVLAYLGDWHSHPGGTGTPSALDRSTARTIARCAEARAPNPLILIVFGRPGRWQIVAYRRGRRFLHAGELESNSRPST